VVFAESDGSSGLPQLQALASKELKDQAGFVERLRALQPELDYDGLFARSLEKRPVVLGYYLNSDDKARTSGVLPEPVIRSEALSGRVIPSTSWTGYGSNLEVFAKAAPAAGFSIQLQMPMALCVRCLCWRNTKANTTSRCHSACSVWWPARLL